MKQEAKKQGSEAAQQLRHHSVNELTPIYLRHQVMKQEAKNPDSEAAQTVETAWCKQTHTDLFETPECNKLTLAFACEVIDMDVPCVGFECRVWDYLGFDSSKGEHPDNITYKIAPRLHRSHWSCTELHIKHNTLAFHYIL
eukprot:794960-Amorphochlora_amoeboformis.AAC.1